MIRRCSRCRRCQIVVVASQCPLATANGRRTRIVDHASEITATTNRSRTVVGVVAVLVIILVGKTRSPRSSSAVVSRFIIIIMKRRR
jgi:hypothetical protein